MIERGGEWAGFPLVPAPLHCVADITVHLSLSVSITILLVNGSPLMLTLQRDDEVHADEVDCCVFVSQS